MPRRSIRRTITSRWLIGYRLAAVSLSQWDGKITAALRPTPLITGMSLNASAYRATSFLGTIATSVAVVLINALGAYNALAQIAGDQDKAAVSMEHPADASHVESAELADDTLISEALTPDENLIQRAATAFDESELVSGLLSRTELSLVCEVERRRESRPITGLTILIALHDETHH